MTEIVFRLPAPLRLPNRKGIARTRAAGAAQEKEARELLAWEIASMLAGQRPAEPLKYVQVSVFRHSLQEPDTDNLYASCKGLLDVLQPSGKRRTYGLGIIENDKPSRCLLKVRHIPVRYRTDQCTHVVIKAVAAADIEATRSYEPAAA